MIDYIESKIENLGLDECSLKNRSLWKLVISPETYMKQRQYLQDYMTIQQIVQWNYIIYFHILGSFFK